MSGTAFTTLNLKKELLENLDSLDYSSMTQIQQSSLPEVLLGKDVIAQAKTGSGKTAVFGLGILQNLDTKKFSPQSLILCPTRELAEQVTNELRKLARSIQNIKILTLCGGVPKKIQTSSLENGVHIVIGTPGRIEEFLEKGLLNIESLTSLVLDEADRMLDMGFEKSLDAIMQYVPKKRQTLLFSATYPKEIEQISKRVMQQPTLIQSESKHDKNTIKQIFFKVSDDEQRSIAVKLLLLDYRPDSAVVFCNTKKQTKELAKDLSARGFSVLALHGDLDQKDRDQTLIRFVNKSISVLVATDVAARGLDVTDLDLVINYHTASDPEQHVHRIGRTGRAGKKGMAFSLFSEKEQHKINRLEEHLEQEVEIEELPDIAILREPTYKAPMLTLQLSGGKKNKIRPGDILGALTGENGIQGSDVGKIQVSANWSYVAINRNVAQAAIRKLSQGKLKGKKYKVNQV